MSVKLITGLKTTADIESQDDGARIYSTISSADRVLNVGSYWGYEIISNNCVRVKDGEALMQGRHVRQAPNTYTDLTINNGEQGKKRYDVIVLRYTKAIGTGIENVELAVVEGTPGTSATLPTLTTGDIFAGCTVHEMALWKVYINGLNISSVTKMFTKLDGMENLYSSLNTRINSLTTTSELTYYVSTSGSNSNSGTSSSYPFKTITYALSQVPKCLKHNVNIYLASGTYTESDVTISGFYGKGKLVINGNTANSYASRSNSSNYQINSLIEIEGNSCPIELNGIQANNGIKVSECSPRMLLKFNIIYPNSSSAKGLEFMPRELLRCITVNL